MEWIIGVCGVCDLKECLNKDITLIDSLLNLVIEGEHQCAASAAEHVGEGALVESERTLVLRDLNPAVQRILVLILVGIFQ